MIINETGIGAFRRDYLTPDFLRDRVNHFGRVFARLPVGLGKTYVCDATLADPKTYEQYDLVIYATSSWDVLNERPILNGSVSSPVEFLVLKGRPADDCGPRADEWADLERRSCSAYGKRTLCRPCPRYDDTVRPCTWPNQLRKLSRYKLIFSTEQQFYTNRSLLPLIKSRSRAERVLLILDEAQLIAANFELTLLPADLETFRSTLAAHKPNSKRPHLIAKCRREIDFLLGASGSELGGHRFNVARTIGIEAYGIQERGIELFGKSFKFLGYELLQLNSCKPTEIWRDPDGSIHFIARPYLGCHVLIMSAHLRANYVAHRLGIDDIDSPFENVIVRHSGTRVLNVRAKVGASVYFGSHHDDVLDTFAVVIARNIAQHRSTLLVSRKRWKQLCAEYLTGRLSGWGIPIRFHCEDYDQLPSTPDPSIIPIIHYGIRGVNTFSDYETAYAMNSYYVSNYELTRAVQEFEPSTFRVALAIYSGANRMRHVEIEPPAQNDQMRTWLAEVYLRQMEVDPAIQALGRVRYATKPREVVFFQMNDLSPDLGPCEDVLTLAALRSTLDIPTAKDVDETLQFERALDLQQQGMTIDEIAAAVGISPRTVFRRLRDEKTAKKGIRILITLFGRVPATETLR